MKTNTVPLNPIRQLKHIEKFTFSAFMNFTVSVTLHQKYNTFHVLGFFLYKNTVKKLISGAHGWLNQLSLRLRLRS